MNKMLHCPHKKIKKKSPINYFLLNLHELKANVLHYNVLNYEVDLLKATYFITCKSCIYAFKIVNLMSTFFLWYLRQFLSRHKVTSPKVSPTDLLKIVWVWNENNKNYILQSFYRGEVIFKENVTLPPKTKLWTNISARRFRVKAIWTHQMKELKEYNTIKKLLF